MAAESICDSCGKRERMIPSRDYGWFKPRDWYERKDDDGIQTACSRKCIEIIAKKTGKTSIVRPI